MVTPLAKAHGTDIGNEVASIGVQVHGGMGYVEETGAAQYFRDARITPIYEGNNGIQAAELVGRKLGLDNGGAFAALVADMRAEAEHPELVALIDTVEAISRRLTTADADDKLAASYPFMTMTSVAVCGWLMQREGRVATGDDDFSIVKRAAVRFYLDQIVPEAMGLRAAASASASVLYQIEPETLTSAYLLKISFLPITFSVAGSSRIEHESFYISRASPFGEQRTQRLNKRIWP